MEETTASAAMLSDPAPPPPANAGADPSTHFVFRHRIFMIDKCRFALNGSDKLPCFYVPMGEQVAAIELRKLQKEFHIPPEDVALLQTVEKGLKYVRDIRPNDSIPREILDGSASWAVEEHHKLLAKSRLNMELIFWITGFRSEMPPLEEMQEMHKDADGRGQLRDAHLKLARLVGLRDARLIVPRIDDLARELAYVEALRELSKKLDDILQKLVSFGAAFKKETSFAAENMRMQDLVRRAIGLIEDKFRKVDDMPQDLPRMVTDLKGAIAALREARDDISLELKKWNEHLCFFENIKIDRSDANERFFRKFYQFLAENYMEQATWGQMNPKKGGK